MARVSALNLTAVLEAAQPGLLAIAEDIAKDTRRGYRLHELKTDNPHDGVIVEETPTGARVVTYNPLAPLDEYDNGGSRFNGPSAAMRSAAAKAGEFHPE